MKKSDFKKLEAGKWYLVCFYDNQEDKHKMINAKFRRCEDKMFFFFWEDDLKESYLEYYEIEDIKHITKKEAELAEQRIIEGEI